MSSPKLASEEDYRRAAARTSIMEHRAMNIANGGQRQPPPSAVIWFLIEEQAQGAKL
jgi:hypothetical protein